MTTIRVRRAGPGDAARIGEIQVSSWRAGYDGIVPRDRLDRLDPEEAGRRWGEILAVPALPVFVSESAAGGGPAALEVAGFCAVSGNRDDDSTDDLMRDLPRDEIAEITALYVAPESWRRGHGRALCQRAILEAAARGYRLLTLWVLSENAAGRAFYERLGFTADGSRSPVPGVGESLTRMRYRIALR